MRDFRICCATVMGGRRAFGVRKTKQSTTSDVIAFLRPESHVTRKCLAEWRILEHDCEHAISNLLHKHNQALYSSSTIVLLL